MSAPNVNDTFVAWAYIEYAKLRPAEYKYALECYQRGEFVALPIAKDATGTSYRCCLVPDPSYLASYSPDDLFTAKMRGDSQGLAFPINLQEVSRWGVRHGDKLQIVRGDAGEIVAVNGCADPEKSRMRPFTDTPYLKLNTIGQARGTLLPAWQVPAATTCDAPLVKSGYFENLLRDVSAMYWLAAPRETSLIAVAGASRTGKTFTTAQLVHQMCLYTLIDPSWHVIILPIADRAKDAATIWETIVSHTPSTPGAVEYFPAPAGMVDPNGIVRLLEFASTYARRLAEMPGYHVLLINDSVAGAFVQHGFSSMPKFSTAAVKGGASSGSIVWLQQVIANNIGWYGADQKHPGGFLTLIGMYFVEGKYNTGTMQTVAFAETGYVTDDTIFFTEMASDYPRLDVEATLLPRNMQLLRLEAPNVASMMMDGSRFVRGGNGTKLCRPAEDAFRRLLDFSAVNPFSLDTLEKGLTMAGLEKYLRLDEEHPRETKPREDRKGRGRS